MKVSAWKGGTYGIRVGHQNAEKFFKGLRTIEVQIDGHFEVFKLSDTFWTTCPEFRGVAIARWLKKNGLAHWPKGRPPRFELTPLGGNRFRLTL